MKKPSIDQLLFLATSVFGRVHPDVGRFGAEAFVLGTAPKLFVFYSYKSLEEIAREMGKKGYKPATLGDLIIYWAMKPPKQEVELVRRGCSIKAPGSVVLSNGVKYAPCIDYCVKGDSDTEIVLTTEKADLLAGSILGVRMEPAEIDLIEFVKADTIYELILWYLEKGDRRAEAESLLLENVERFRDRICWNLSEENLKLLDRCVNENPRIDDGTWTETRNDFVVAAFKDLSTFRNPKAMSIFGRIRTICTMIDGELLLWGRSITRRTDGSAVVVLHTSNLNALASILHGMFSDGSLEQGLMIYGGSFTR